MKRQKPKRYYRGLQEIIKQLQSYNTRCADCKKVVAVEVDGVEYFSDMSAACSTHDLCCREMLEEAAGELDNE